VSLGHSAKCWEFGISWKNFKNRTGFHQVRFHCLASLSGKIGNYRSGVIGKLGIIGNYRELSGSQFFPIIPESPGIIGNYLELSGIIGSQFWQSVLVIINHVFACLQNIAVLSRHCHQSAIAAWRVPQNTCVITSFLRVTLRDVVTMFTFAIVSTNAWVRQCKTSSGVTAPPEKPPTPNTLGGNS
jgi:hypothetical protein